MKCGYCGVAYDDNQPHYCVQGRDFLVRENKRLREAMKKIRVLTSAGSFSVADLRFICEEALK